MEQNSIAVEDHAIENNNQYLAYAGLAFFACLLLVFVVMGIKLGHVPQKQIQPSAIAPGALINKLDEINTELQQLRSASIPDANKQAITQLIKSITDLQQSMAEKSDIKNIVTQLNTVKADVDSQIGELKTLVNQNTKQSKTITQANLPFHCLSVDNIGGKPMLSVSYQHMILPLLVGDTLAGWQIIQLSRDEQTIEFHDPHGETVTLHLN